MVRKYILENYPNCIRKKGCSKDALDLPYSYTSPCAKGLFDDLFYWDTYFINLGLIELNQVAVEEVDKELMLKSAKANACFLRIGMGQ